VENFVGYARSLAAFNLKFPVERAEVLSSLSLLRLMRKSMAERSPLRGEGMLSVQDM
jgi:hypothetical protein